MRAYPYEMRDNAAALYVEKGLTLEQVAGALNVALNTIRKWAKSGEWQKRKKAKQSLKTNLQLLRVKLVENALDTLDPNDVFAIAKLERVMQGIVPETIDNKDEEAKKDKSRGLSDQTVEEIRRKILGLKQ